LIFFSGGMDVYVRQFGKNLTHDQFYSNQTILNAFLNYTDQIVTRYVNSTAVFSWELANDPRFVIVNASQIRICN